MKEPQNLMYISGQYISTDNNIVASDELLDTHMTLVLLLHTEIHMHGGRPLLLRGDARGDSARAL